MATIDNLEIEISGSAKKASDSIDKLVSKLGELSNSLGKINGTKLMDFSNSLDVLSQAMKRFKEADIKASNFKTVATGIGKFANIDATKISNVGNALTVLSSNLQNISGVNFNPQGLVDITSVMNKLGGKLVTQATTNLPIISQNLREFVQGLNDIQNVSFNVESLGTLINSISKLGGKKSTQATANLPTISKHLREFINGLNDIGSLNFDITNLSGLVNAISRLGSVATGRAITNIPLLANVLKKLFTTLSTAPNVSQNIIDMTNALANLASQGGKVGTATNTLVGNLNRYTTASSRASKSTLSLAAAFGKFYATYWLVIRGIKGLFKSIESTSDYIEAFNYYNVAFNKVAEDWSQDYEKYGYENAETYASSFTDRMNDSLGKLSGIKFDEKGMRLVSTEVKNLGLNIQEVTQFAAQLASVTNSVGLTGEASLAASDSFTKLAGDISSLFNVDYKTVSQNLQSGLIGQSRALYKYGIDITNATLQTYAYELGLEKLVKNMTQAEKMQLRMIAILDQSRVSWGDLANTINQPANAMRVLKAQASELSMMFGQLFIPVLSKVIPVLTGITIALKRLVSAIAGFFGIKIDYSNMSQGFNDMETETEDLSDGLDNVASSAKKAKAGLRGFDELKTINMPEVSGGGVGGAGDMLDLTDEILKATEEYQKAFDEAFKKMEDRAKAFADKIEQALKPLREMFKNISEGNWKEAGKNLSDFFVGITNSLTRFIEDIPWGEMGKNIGEFLAGFDESDVFNALVKLKKAIVKGLKEMWSASFKEAPFETAFLTALTLMKLPFLNSILKKIGNFIVQKIATQIALNKIINQSLIKSLSTVTTGNTAASLFAKFQAFGATLLGKFAIGVASFFAGWNIGKLINNALYDAGIVDVKNDKSFFGYLAEIKSGFEDGSWKGALQLWGQDIADGFHFIGDELALMTTNGKKDWDGLMDSFFGGIESTAKSFSEWWSILTNKTVVGWENTKQSWSQGWEKLKYDTENGWNKVVGLANVSWDNIQQSFYQGWLKITTWWENSAISKWWNEDVAPWFTKEKWINVMSGIKVGFETTWTNAINSIKSIWNKFAKWLNDKLSFEIPSFTNPFTGNVSKGTTIKLGKIPTYATGGFPDTADLFYANENGIPELVGTVGGRTAVASGTEITGISDAIYATGQTEAGLLQSAVGLLQVIAEKEYGISADALFKSVQKSAQNYSKRTGRLAFSG